MQHKRTRWDDDFEEVWLAGQIFCPLMLQNRRRGRLGMGKPQVAADFRFRRGRVSVLQACRLEKERIIEIWILLKGYNWPLNMDVCVSTNVGGVDKRTPYIDKSGPNTVAAQLMIQRQPIILKLCSPVPLKEN